MKKIIISLLLLLGGAAIFVFGSPYYTVFPTNRNQTYYVLLVLFFLIISLALRRSPSLSTYWPAAYSLLIASTALLFFSTGVLNLQRNTMGPLQYLAIDKLSQFLHVVPVIIGLTLVAREDLKSIFIQRGNLRLGLGFGLVSFFVFGAISFIIWRTSSSSPSSVLPAIPWLLIFVFANAIMEELWFRAIFLKKYSLLIGKSAAILVTSLVFGASHINATYAFPGGGIVFGLVVFTIGLIGAYIMVRTDSLTGPVLFHAGYDLLVILPILDSL